MTIQVSCTAQVRVLQFETRILPYLLSMQNCMLTRVNFMWRMWGQNTERFYSFRSHWRSIDMELKFQLQIVWSLWKSIDFQNLIVRLSQTVVQSALKGISRSDQSYMKIQERNTFHFLWRSLRFGFSLRRRNRESRGSKSFWHNFYLKRK